MRDKIAEAFVDELSKISSPISSMAKTVWKKARPAVSSVAQGFAFSAPQMLQGGMSRSRNRDPNDLTSGLRG